MGVRAQSCANVKKGFCCEKVGGGDSPFRNEQPEPPKTLYNIKDIKPYCLYNMVLQETGNKSDG